MAWGTRFFTSATRPAVTPAASRKAAAERVARLTADGKPGRAVEMVYRREGERQWLTIARWQQEDGVWKYIAPTA